MRRIVFTVLTLSPLAAWGQSGEIPGRDLLTFPVGLTAEAPALGTTAGTGLWNPATALLPEPQSIGNPVPYGTTVISLAAASERASWLFGANFRVRLGIVPHYAGYNIGVAREDGVNGLAPTYQFSLSSLLK